MCSKFAANPSRTPKTEILPNSKCRRERERFSEREFRGVGLVKEGWTKVNRSDRQERNGNKREERVASLFKETAVKSFGVGVGKKKRSKAWVLFHIYQDHVISMTLVSFRPSGSASADLK
ncbi:hypothetical protein CDAR_296411 [Caerostris darwini]|uniref:Uncharacterized protein n=1 Tax=Caerostris darwini TaxID=1538125 RepID=A0AAV4PLF2_9ARAC|nr:hypothetical protein CDAR_296411 [Caerostris darwini]